MATAKSGGLSLQSTGDFFKSASRNINIVIWLVRILALGFLYILVNEILSILNPGVTDRENLNILFTIIILVFFVIFLALLTFAVAIATPLSDSLNVPELALQYFNAARAFILTNLFGDVDVESIEGFDKNVFFNSADPLAPLAYLINKPQRNLYNSEALNGLIILLIILMIITGIGFVKQSSVQLAGATLVISQIIIGLANMKELTVELTLDPTSLQTLFASNLFRLAFISYLYFEFSLQTGYLYSLASPTLSRQKRVSKQLSKLSEFRLGITKLGTEDEQATAKAVKAKTDAEHEEQGVEKTSSALATSSDSTAARHFGSDALLFLLDSAQDSLFAKPGGEQERLTGRLQRYHDGLLAHDRKIDNKLGGSAEKAFNPFWILITVVISMSARVIIIVVLAWFTLNPDRVLAFISLPPTVTNSLEIKEPEGILMVLIPSIFFILGISYFLTKAQSFIVKAEELIIQESDIQKLLRAGKAISSKKDADKARAAIDSEKEKERKEMEKTKSVGKSKGKKKRKGKRKTKKSKK